MYSVPVRIMATAITGAYLGAMLILWALGREDGESEESNPGMGTSHDARPPHPEKATP